MVEKIYNSEFYTKEFDTNVTAVNGREIKLDRTALYSRGGQLCDIGTFAIDGNSINVVETRTGDSGGILHLIDSDANIATGAKIRGKIAWYKRYEMMSHHTALHGAC